MPVPTHNVLTCKTKISKKTKCQFCKNENLYYFCCSHGSKVIFEILGKNKWIKHKCKEREVALLLDHIRSERFSLNKEDLLYEAEKYISKMDFEFLPYENLQKYIDIEFNQLDLQFGSNESK